MKLLLQCFACDESKGHVWVELEDAGVYLLTCEVGHTSRHALMHPKWEILFEMALVALADGYTREAVATLATSLEEFYRVFIKTVLHKRAISDDKVKIFWKLVDRAEPQLGAFICAYLLERGELPTFPDKKSNEFRNSVIHRGKIPKIAEVNDYGERIVQFLVPLYMENTTLAADVTEVTTVDQDQLLPPGEFERTGGTFHQTSFAHIVYDDVPRTFAEAVKFASDRSFFRTHARAG